MKKWDISKTYASLAEILSTARQCSGNIAIIKKLNVYRNLATNLVTHERITTTVEKAKELRPFIERLVRKAKEGGYQGNVALKQTLFTKKAIDNMKNNIAPRFE